ncbi:MAG: ASPIC/UnbV domain-containing protein [Verrucomicrobiota bacterium]
MRSNKQLNPRFITSQNWTFERGPGGELKNLIPTKEGSDNPYISFSHSGNEQNRMFLNHQGTRFSNVSGISGADSILDGRSFIHWDFNRDGKPDLAVVNANKKLLQIFANQTPHQNHFIAFRLQGASQKAKPSKNHSNRDAIGAAITLRLGDQSLLRVLSCGEGFASQNSRTILIGIGQNTKIDSAKILWPSGKTTEMSDLSHRTLIFANESDSGIRVENYYLD